MKASELVAASLLARSAQNLLGVVATARAGLLAEAATLARCCVENTLWLTRMHGTDGGIPRAVLDDLSRKSASSAAPLPPEALPLFGDGERELVADLLEARRLRQAAVAGRRLTREERRGCLISGFLSANLAEPSLPSLARHFTFKAPLCPEFLAEPPLAAKDFVPVFLLASLAVLGAMELCGVIFPTMAAADEITALETDLVAFWEQPDAL